MVIEMFKVLISVLQMVKHLLLSMDLGTTTKLLRLVNGGNGGWDPAEKRAGRGACPDHVLWL